MKKKAVWGLAAAFAVAASAMGTQTYLSVQEGENLRCVINASREEYLLDESIAQADAVAEIQVEGIVSELDEGIPQTLHKASVIETYKGDLPEEINVLQDGTRQMPMGDNPVFKEGEKYILVMKKTESLADNNNSFWILKEYFVSGDQAIETLPTGEMAADEAGIETCDLGEGWNQEVSRKEAELTYDSEVLKKSDLVDFIEGVQ